MGILVLVLLVAAWGLVLGPALLRNSQDPDPIQTEKMFNRALKALGGPRRPRPVVGGRWVLVPPSTDYPPRPAGERLRPTATVRRRRNLTGLAGFAILTFALGLFRPLRFLLYLSITADVLLIVYLIAVLYFAARPVQIGSRRGIVGEDARPPEAAGGHL